MGAVEAMLIVTAATFMVLLGATLLDQACD